MEHEDKVFIQSDGWDITISLDEIVINKRNEQIKIDKKTNQKDNLTIAINTSELFYLPFPHHTSAPYNHIYAFGYPNILSQLLKKVNDTYSLYDTLEKSVYRKKDYNSLLLFDKIKIDRYVNALYRKINTDNFDEINTASINLISLFDRNTITDIELYLLIRFSLCDLYSHLL